MSKGKVMIIEDDELSALWTKKCVELAGYETCPVAESAEEAHLYMRTNSPDVLLMDINLPCDRNGIDLATEFWELFKIPSIFITAYDLSEVPFAMKSPGAKGYIRKPIQQKELNQVLDNVFQHGLEVPLRPPRPPDSVEYKNSR